MKKILYHKIILDFFNIHNVVMASSKPKGFYRLGMGHAKRFGMSGNVLWNSGKD